jgi:uncharacterized protein
MNIQSAEAKLAALKNILKSYGSVMIGLSGGVDSTFLVKVASQTLGEKAVAATALSYIYPSWESREAEETASSLGMEYVKVPFDPIKEVEGFEMNPKDRCYLCKSYLFSALKQKAEAMGIACVADGTNADDINDYRPGLRALKELDIKSPLLEAGLTKEEIRYFSKQLGLSTFSKPSFACLASRIPYGERISRNQLEMIERAETFILSKGFKNVRVRCHGNLARIELNRDEMQRAMEESMRDEINKVLKSIGFEYVSIDLSGYRTGSMNVEV